jgi:xanthine/CO dehydrogenase XdhC/CoxF family maturation factor
MKELLVILAQLQVLLKEEEAIALATVVHVDGSAYRRPGARMLIDANGNWWGGISGGCLEGDLLKKAQLAMVQQSIKRITYDTREDDPFQLGVGLGCEGLIEIVIDPIRENIERTMVLLIDQLASAKPGFIRSQWTDHSLAISNVENSVTGWDEKLQVFTEYLPVRTRIWVVGNQFDACSMIELCLSLAWEVHWVGNSAKMRKDLKDRVVAYYDWDVDYELRSSDYLLLMTHDFDRDVSFLNQHVRDQSFQYVGILGPTKRFDRLIKQLDFPLVSDISTPVGLDIGAEGPDEIALAVAAEILAVQNKRDGQRLKFRASTIH